MELWVKTVYDFAVAYNKRGEQAEVIPDRLIDSLVPIYFGRTASFALETQDMPTYEAEEVIEGLCDRFEDLKPYLVQRWREAGTEG
jgi:hypothetical protein